MSRELRQERDTMGQINQEYRLKYWATSSSVRSFTRTVLSFACSALLALLSCSALLASLACSALFALLARSLRSLPHSWDSEGLDGYFFCVFFLFWPMAE